MKKIIYDKFDKKMIPNLPRIVFPGKIVVILNNEETKKAVDFLLSCKILGIDTETRPSFKKGNQHKVSLLQVCNHDTCFLFRLNHIGTTSDIVRLLEDENIPKIGLSLHDDINALHKVFDFKPGMFIDLQDNVRDLGIEDLSLQKLYANIFGEKITKRQQLSNWETDILSDSQKQYAATDAWACIMLYEELKRLKETNDYQLITTTKEEHLNIK